MMNALFITHSAALSGAELVMLRVISGLRGYADALVLENGPLVAEMHSRHIRVSCAPLSDNIAKIRRDDGFSKLVRTVPHGARVVRKISEMRRDYDVTVAFSQKAFVLTCAGQPWVRRPLVWALNDIMNAQHFSKAMRLVGSNMARACARRIVVNSEASASAAIAAGLPSNRITVIYPGIQLRAFQAGTPMEHQGADHRLRVGCFSRLAPWKGQHVLLEALKAVPNVEAWVVGAALFGENDYEKQLRDVAEEPELRNRIKFLGFRTDVPRLMQLCDVVVHTSTIAEPFGQVVVEGLASGRPVVATAAGGVLEIIRDGIDGLLVEPGNVGALADCLKRLADDPTLRAALAERGKVRSHKFRSDVMINAFEKLLFSLKGTSVPKELYTQA